jgi:CRISPR-associated endonuclease/helicase Cas3
MTDLYAKNNGERLKEHTRKVLDGVKHLRKMVTNNNPVFSDEFWNYLERAAFIHDFGKASDGFQAYIKRFIKGETRDKDVALDELIPHSALSVVLSNWFDWEMDDRWRQIILSSIFFHHDRSKLYNIQTAGNIEKIPSNTLEALKNEFNGFDPEFTQFIAGELKNINYRYLNFLIAPDIVYIKQSNRHLSTTEVDLRKYIFFKGFLHRADHYASFLEKGDEDVSRIEIAPLDISKVEENVLAEINKSIADERKLQKEQLWQFDKLTGGIQAGQNIILIGSTGIGKTEFAFLWGAGRKMFFTLPMRTMTNEIFKRAREIFGESVGLLHSSAAAVLSQSTSKSLETETSDIEFNIGLSRNLSYPVIVCTGDQILNVSLKYPTYEKIMSTLGYSSLIIDEIQAYSPETSAIIVKTIEDTVHLGGNFLLMTATLPDYIKEEIKSRTKVDEADIFQVYSKRGVQDIEKHKLHLVETVDSENEDKLESSILEEVKKITLDNPGKRILVTINTVKKSQGIFKRLIEDTAFLSKASIRKEDIMLLHSRFIVKHRESKVDIITYRREIVKNPPDIKILITTQIIEASVNIDYDILISELAPLDSLIQRMGRVNRNRGEYAPGKGDVYIIDRYFKGSVYVYKKETLDLTLKSISEKIGQNMILSEKEKERLLSHYYTHEDYHKIKKQFEKNLYALDNLLLASSKSEAQRIFREVNSFDVIPFEVYGEFKEAFQLSWESFLKEKGEKDLKKRFKIDIRRLLTEYSTSLRISEFEKVYPVGLGIDLSDDESFEGLKKELDLKRFFKGYFVILRNSRWRYDSDIGLMEASREEKEQEADNIS